MADNENIEVENAPEHAEMPELAASDAATKSVITRRELLLKSAKAALMFTIVPRYVLGGPGYAAPSETITRGVIGTGGQGMAGHVIKNEEGRPMITLAVCDVDKNHLAAAVDKAGEVVLVIPIGANFSTAVIWTRFISRRHRTGTRCKASLLRKPDATFSAKNR